MHISVISSADSSGRLTESGDDTCAVTDEDSLVSIHNSFICNDSGEKLISTSDMFQDDQILNTVIDFEDSLIQSVASGTTDKSENTQANKENNKKTK